MFAVSIKQLIDRPFCDRCISNHCCYCLLLVLSCLLFYIFLILSPQIRKLWENMILICTIDTVTDSKKYSITLWSLLEPEHVLTGTNSAIGNICNHCLACSWPKWGYAQVTRATGVIMARQHRLILDFTWETLTSNDAGCFCLLIICTCSEPMCAHAFSFVILILLLLFCGKFFACTAQEHLIRHTLSKSFLCLEPTVLFIGLTKFLNFEEFQFLMLSIVYF